MGDPVGINTKKPTPTRHEAIAAVVRRWKILLRYFPAEGADEIMEYLDSLLAAEPKLAAEQLAWLNDAMVNRVGEWCGAKELRGVFSWRYVPRDGVLSDCSTTGPAAMFSPLAGEARQIESHEQRRLEAGIPQRLLTGEVAENPVADAEFSAKIRELAEAKKLKGAKPRRDADFVRVDAELKAILGIRE